MRKSIFLLFLIIQNLFFAQNASPVPAIIPKPNKMVVAKDSFFVLSSETQLVFTDLSLKSDAEIFAANVRNYAGYALPLVAEGLPAAQKIVFKQISWPKNSPEKYELVVSKRQITISAQKNGSGFFYGLQSLFQMIIPLSAPQLNGQPSPINIPCLVITDEPRYAWRGMHLDVSRHFFDVEFIKRYIDLLAAYKINTFHWHLTDDQGWRIEIKKYPNLTVVGAWRKGTMIGRPADNKYDDIRYGGYYTQEQVKDVVAYAQARHVTIVPEIEMPGHSVAAIAAYPYLSCTGKQIDVEKGWGVFDDVYCTKDSTFTFIEDVLTEVMQLFPGNYIHIGGDECPRTRWKQCKNCQALMKKEHLMNENGLQSYFIKRVEKFVNSKGRQIIGWDEILEGGLAPNAALMSWRGTKGGIAAAKVRHKVVMSPGRPCYFDHYQSTDRTVEPLAIGGYNPVDSVYAYDPTPPGLLKEQQAFIMGAQANLWTEYISTNSQAEYMLMPRMIALSEVLWTEKENKDVKDFKARLTQNVKWLDDLKVNYAKHFITK